MTEVRFVEITFKGPRKIGSFFFENRKEAATFAKQYNRLVPADSEISFSNREDDPILIQIFGSGRSR